MFSFLLPTRKREKDCIAAIESLLNTCDNKDNMEVIIGFDKDDESIEPILAYCRKTGIEYSARVFGTRYGYRGLHHYINAMSKDARHEYIWYWSDDALMKTPKWDNIMIENIKNNPNLIWDFEVHFPWVFPLVPRAFIEAMGFYSINPHIDTWVEVLFDRILHMGKKESRIEIFHHMSQKDTSACTLDYTERHAENKWSVQDQFSDFFDMYRIMTLQSLKKNGIITKEYNYLTYPGKRVGCIGMNPLGICFSTFFTSNMNIVMGYDKNPKVRSGIRPCQYMKMIEETSNPMCTTLCKVNEHIEFHFIDNLSHAVEMAEVLVLFDKTMPGIPEATEENTEYFLEALKDLADLCKRLKVTRDAIIISQESNLGKLTLEYRNSLCPSHLRSFYIPYRYENTDLLKHIIQHPFENFISINEECSTEDQRNIREFLDFRCYKQIDKEATRKP